MKCKECDKEISNEDKAIVSTRDVEVSSGGVYYNGKHYSSVAMIFHKDCYADYVRKEQSI